MVLLIILLSIAIVLQLFAASTAIRLTGVTKFNSSWFLITIGLVLMCVLRVDELLKLIGHRYHWEWALNMPDWLSGWLGVITSLCFALGVFMIKKILNYMAMMENQRRNYESRILNAVIQAEEKQRQNFSKELHDGLGPLLSSAKMSVSAISSTNDPEIKRQILDNTERTLNMAIKSLREISNNLSPHVLERFGVARAVENFINRLLNPVSEFQIEFNNDLKDFRFTPEHEVIVYRVVCELINNTMKHANASRVKLDMFHDRNLLTIDYQDNGQGFDTAQVPIEGMGISNVSSRVGSIGGEIQIRSTPGQGTRVAIKLPL